MTRYLKCKAVRLTFSLLTLSALGGCAVYGPVPGPYAYYGSDAYGQAVYASPYSPYYYGPVYIGPPVSLNLGFGYWGGGGGRGGGRGGFYGHGGRGGRGGGRH